MFFVNAFLWCQNLKRIYFMNDKEAWGYASCDDDGNLTYTRYQSDGSVNRYSDNGDGGHTHQHWNSASGYNASNDADQSRIESNDSSNPSTDEVQSGSGCFLTTACVSAMKNDFRDNCYELTILRAFRDSYAKSKYVSEIERYYKIDPHIVNAINNCSESMAQYKDMFDRLIVPIVRLIENKNFEEAFQLYRSYSLELEKQWLI